MACHVIGSVLIPAQGVYCITIPARPPPPSRWRDVKWNKEERRALSVIAQQQQHSPGRVWMGAGERMKELESIRMLCSSLQTGESLFAVNTLLQLLRRRCRSSTNNGLNARWNGVAERPPGSWPIVRHRPRSRVGTVSPHDAKNSPALLDFPTVDNKGSLVPWIIRLRFIVAGDNSSLSLKNDCSLLFALVSRLLAILVAISINNHRFTVTSINCTSSWTVWRMQKNVISTVY